MTNFSSHANSTPHQAAKFIAGRIASQLAEGKSVLWLLSGGSGGQVCVEASQLLKTRRNLSNLYVTMSDERYGELDHPDENMSILLNAGLDLPGAAIYRPLNGKPRDQTTADFNNWLNEVGQVVDYKFAVLGIGADAHTAGIKPDSIAATSPRAAVDFTGDDFERITITSKFLSELDEAVVQAFGESKREVVEQLRIGEGDPVNRPMLTIRDIKQVALFSDN